MIIDTTSSGAKLGQPSDMEDNDYNHHLRLDPGATERKPRSIGKLCLWLTIILVGLVGTTTVYFLVNNFLHSIQHPHSQMYYKPLKGEKVDLSTVVQPMIKEQDSFDIVASVWMRDDAGGGGRDGMIYIDGEERPEKLIYSDTVFRNVNFKSKHQFTNVSLSIPTNHFKQRNISNYDLRASFVLVQPQHPSWLDRAQKFKSWKPDSLHFPKVRPLGHVPTLEDRIYDSFGITIPLLEFHETSSNVKIDSPTATVEATLDDSTEEIEEDALLLEGIDAHSRKKSDVWLDIFHLEFTGDQKTLTHPFIISRTHLGIVDETNLYQRAPYIRAQSELAQHMCKNNPNAVWYQCMRMFFSNGVFETKVQIAASSEDADGKKTTKGKQYEFLYAPYLHAVRRAPGPKDLVSVPVDRQAIALNLKKEMPEYVNVTWRLSFQANKPVHQFFHMWTGGPPSEFNMTATEEELTYIQHKHDSALGFAGFRIHENAHPRRNYLISFVSGTVRALCWFLTIHYWYTRTSTVGISRFGTTLVALYFLLDANQAMITSVFDPKGTGFWLSRVPFTYVFLLIPPFFMLKAVTRLEFGASKKGKETRTSFGLGVYFAKATHSERASERIGAKISYKSKILFLISLFAIAHLFAGPYSYFLSPEVQPPSPTPHPLHALSDHVPVVLQHIYSLGLTLELGGTVFQFIMNVYSRTYAGKYKAAAFLMLVADAILFLDLVPTVVGTSKRLGGVLVREGLGLIISAVDFAQAMKYKSARTSEAEGVEE